MLSKPKMDPSKVVSYDTLVHAVAGAAGSLTAMSVFFPLDTIRSRLQVEEGREAKHTLIMIKDLVKEEGLETLYRGILPVLTSLCCSNFVYFYTFHGLRSFFLSDIREHSALKDLALASLAGIVNVLLTTPLWVVNSRIKMQGVRLTTTDSKQMKKYPYYHGLLDGIYKIIRDEGMRALWSSVIPSLILVCNPAIQFMIYEALKREALMSAESKALGAATYFIIGAISKSISTTVTYPLQLVQSKLRYDSESLKKMNVFQAMIYILRIRGVKGLFKGLESKLLQTVLTAALMFLCYEKIVAFVFQIMKKSTASH